jgi:AraC family transcriptional regulator
MAVAALAPTTAFFRFDESSTLRHSRADDRFAVWRVECTGPVPEPVRKSSEVSALLVSMSVCSLPASDYRLWVDGKLVPTPRIAAFRSNVIDLAAEPEIWSTRGLHYVHFHLRRSVIDDVAADLGYERVGAFRLSVLAEDLLLAQLTKSILPSLGRARGARPLALDQLELILGAHVLQRYGATRQRRSVAMTGLAAWQRKRAMDILRQNLDGSVRLADLARECDLSVSHFARSFKASFGVTCHRWLTERRIERAKDLLVRTNEPLVDVASQSGFGDQAAFTRTFHRNVGVTPGRWRRERSTGARKK